MRTTLVCVSAVLIGVLCLLIDRPVAEWMLAGGLPGDVRALFHRVEAFGHTYGLICIAVTIYLLDQRQRSRLVGVIGAFAAAGLTADLIKIAIWRIRPCRMEDVGTTSSTFVGTIWSSDANRLAIAFDSTYHSFPSAHTACAVALAYQLGRLYPTGQLWFYALAAMCAMNRIDGGAHFASDVCWGAALGYGVAVAVQKVGSREHRDLRLFGRIWQRGQTAARLDKVRSIAS